MVFSNFHAIKKGSALNIVNTKEENYKMMLMKSVENLSKELVDISDYIFDHPEIGYKEFKACKVLSEFLKKNGFEVELGYGGLETAFRAIYRNGRGGPCIGLLCEYDALETLGHGCAHHLQGPSTIGAAMALKECFTEYPFTIEVIGTPAEETAEGGKNVMLDNNAFKQLDVALMMHGGDSTITDIRSMALSEYVVTFYGLASHAAIAPDKGRSALEALMLAFNGISYLHNHVADDVRIHGIIEDGGKSVNTIPDKASARFEFRSYSRSYLDSVISRTMKVFEGAALMTDTTFEVKRVVNMHNKIPVISLNNLLMSNAKVAGASRISPPREKTGSTDFASVMYHVPGSCIRVPFVERGFTSHTQYWVDRGKSKEAHDALLLAAKILAMTSYDLITDDDLMNNIREEFEHEKSKNRQI